MPTLSSAPASTADRGGLFARTALCGALCGLALLPGTSRSAARRRVSGSQVSAGGTAPVINTGDDRIDVTPGRAAHRDVDWSSFDVEARRDRSPSTSATATGSS